MAAKGHEPPLSSTMDDPDAVETGAEPISADLRHYRLDPLADRRGAGDHLDIPSPPSVMRTSSNGPSPLKPGRGGPGDHYQ